MRAELRKQAVQAYKERKPIMGGFAVQCTATGECWVGKSRNLDTQQNGLWFSFRLGSGRNAALQAAWLRYGAEAFTFTPLAQLKDDETLYPDTRLRELLSEWRIRLGGHLI